MYIKVHVIPDSREEGVKEKEDTLYISVREKAEQGAANRRMLVLLRAHLGKSNVRIISGHHAPHKIISID